MGWDKKATSGYNYVLGANNHTLPNGNDVPVCIVVCTQHRYKVSGNVYGENDLELGGWQVVFHNSTEWKVVSSRVQLVRYFAASTAKVTLAIDITQMNGKIPPPGLTFKNPTTTSNNFRADLFKYNEVYDFEKQKEETYEIRPEMQIEIYMGYINSYTTVSNYIKHNSGVYEIDSTKFTKVFNGVIDSVDLKLGRGENPMDGITCTITARDQVRYLIDNKFFGPLKLPGEDFSSTKGVNRNKIVRALIEQGSAGACHAEPEDGGGILFHPTGRPPMRVTGNYTNETKDKDKVSFLTGVGSPFSIADQFPVDAIRWFSLIEPYPRELYCDVETGRIAWTVRMLGEPVKTQEKANLFGALEDVQESLNLGDETQNLTQIILKYLNDSHQLKDLFTNYTVEDAQHIEQCINKVYKQGHALYGFEEIFPPWALLALYVHESNGLNPYISVQSIDRDRKNPVLRTSAPYNQPVLTKKGNLYIPGRGASGISQVMLNTHLSKGKGQGYTQFLPSNDSRDPSISVSQFINYQAFENINIPVCTDHYISFGAGILKNVAIASLMSSLGVESPQDLRDKFNSTMDCVWTIARSYHGFHSKAMKAAIAEVGDKKLKYEIYKKYADKPEYSAYKDPRSFRESVNYIPSFALRVKAITTSLAAVLTDEDKSALKDVKTTAPFGISVFKGVDDPWLFSYKQTVSATVKNRKIPIKPNIISGHSGWSTLGVITSFTLLNPASANGLGGVGVKSNHSWFGDPTTVSTEPKNSEYTQLHRVTLGPPSVIGPNSIDNAQTIARLAKETSNFSVNQENSTVNGNSQVAPNEVVSKLKYLSKIRLPYRHRYIWDESSDSRMTDDSANLILNAMMNIYGRDIHSADFTVPLNPDIRPGHAAQMYNMGFFNGELFRVEGVIHMFALGGVQNGCTTMVAAVSPQGSQDPIDAVKELSDIVNLQSNGAGLVEEAKSKVFSQTIVNYFNTHSVKEVNSRIFTLDYTPLNAYDQNIDKLFDATNHIEKIRAIADNKEKFRNMFKSKLYNYCFSHLYAYVDMLSGSGGEKGIYSYVSSFDDTDFARYIGVSFKQSADDLIGHINNIYTAIDTSDTSVNKDSINDILQDFQPQAGVREGVPLFIDKHLGFIQNHGGKNPDVSMYQKFILNNRDNDSIPSNLDIMKFRKDLGLIPHQISAVHKNLYYLDLTNPVESSNYISQQRSSKEVLENYGLSTLFYMFYVQSRGSTPAIGNVNSTANVSTILGHIKKDIESIKNHDYKTDYNNFYLDTLQNRIDQNVLGLESSSEFQYVSSCTPDVNQVFKQSLRYSFVAHVYLSFKCFMSSASYDGNDSNFKKLYNYFVRNNLESELIKLIEKEADDLNAAKEKL